MKGLSIKKVAFHGEWNYTILPKTRTGSVILANRRRKAQVAPPSVTARAVGRPPPGRAVPHGAGPVGGVPHPRPKDPATPPALPQEGWQARRYRERWQGRRPPASVSTS